MKELLKAFLPLGFQVDVTFSSGEFLPISIKAGEDDDLLLLDKNKQVICKITSKKIEELSKIVVNLDHDQQTDLLAEFREKMKSERL